MPARVTALSIRTQLAAMFAGLAFVTVGAGGFVAVRASGNALEREVLRRFECSLRGTAAVLDARLGLLVQRAESASRDLTEFLGPSAQREFGFPGGKGWMDRLHDELLVRISDGTPELIDLDVVLADGGWIRGAETYPAESLEGLGDSARWTLSFCESVVGEGGPGIAVAVPLLERPGKLLAWFDLESWIGEAGIPGTSEGEGPMMTLIDSQRRRLGPPKLGSLDSCAANWMNRESLTGAATWEQSLPLDAPGWHLLGEASIELTGASVDPLQARIVGLGTLLILGASLLFLIPLRFLTRPLARLAGVAKQIEEGDYTARADIDTYDEFGDLGRSFDAMAEAIERSSDRLEETARNLRDRQRDLARERDRLGAVLSSMRDGLIVLDGEGTPELYNRAAAPFLRKLQEDRAHLAPHHRCGDAAESRDACRRCLFDPRHAPRSCQLEIEGRVYEVHTTRLGADNSGAAGRVLVIHDLSERVGQDEGQIHQERLAVLGEIAAVMAHELNNPLAAIKMYSQMSVDSLGDDPTQNPTKLRGDLSENLRVIQRNTESCEQAIRDMLDYAASAPPEIGEVDVRATLEDVEAFTRPLCRRANVRLELDVGTELILAHGDEVQIRQIFVNLVLNGIQAMDDAGGLIRVRAEQAGTHVLVTIQDDGPGIPIHLQGEVFRPFFTTKPRGAGTGLGLSTARRIAEMFGGGVELLRSPHKGTKFRVLLQAATG